MKIINYEEEFGKIKFPEGFEQKLIGKTMEEQMECYRITESVSFTETACGEITSEELREKTYKLEEYSKCVGLIVKGDMLVGVLIKGWPFDREIKCLPYEGVCTYYASDNEGSGTNDREDYAYLICV